MALCHLGSGSGEAFFPQGNRGTWGRKRRNCHTLRGLIQWKPKVSHCYISKEREAVTVSCYADTSRQYWTRAYTLDIAATQIL